MKTLIIDTSDNKQIKAGVIIDGKEYIEIQNATQKKAQVILPLIVKILREHDITLEELTDIKIATGPGSFTGLRVGAAIANTLGTVLGIPINEKKVGELTELTYS